MLNLYLIIYRISREIRVGDVPARATREYKVKARTPTPRPLSARRVARACAYPCVRDYDTSGFNIQLDGIVGREPPSYATTPKSGDAQPVSQIRHVFSSSTNAVGPTEHLLLRSAALVSYDTRDISLTAQCGGSRKDCRRLEGAVLRRSSGRKVVTRMGAAAARTTDYFCDNVH